jgi:glycosyltransferase involved in cell wall biosynthesis
MAYQIPLIVSEVNVLPEMVRPDSGIIVTKDNVKMWSHAMERLCANPQERRAFGNAGFSFAEKHFDISVMAEKTIAAFRQFGASAIE